MPAPIAPIALNLARIGAVAAIAWYVRRDLKARPKHAWREAAMDDLADGVEITGDRGEREANGHAAARVRRTMRFGTLGGVELDLSAMGRVRLRRIE